VFRRDRCARLEGVTFHLRIYKNETRARRLVLPPFSRMSFLRGTIVTCRRSSDTFLQGKTLEMGFFGSREYTEPMLGRQGSSRRWNGLALTPRNASVSAPFPLPRSKLKMGIGPLKFAQRPVHNLLNNLFYLFPFLSLLPSPFSFFFLSLFLSRFHFVLERCFSPFLLRSVSPRLPL